MRMKLWTVFLGLWLIMQGLMGVIGLSFRYDDVIVGTLAIIAGVLIFIRK